VFTLILFILLDIQYKLLSLNWNILNNFGADQCFLKRNVRLCTCFTEGMLSKCACSIVFLQSCTISSSWIQKVTTVFCAFAFFVFNCLFYSSFNPFHPQCVFYRIHTTTFLHKHVNVSYSLSIF